MSNNAEKSSFAKATEDKTRSGALISAASLVAISSLLSRLLGLFRDRLFAEHFGAGPELDAYFAAYRIPDIIFNLLVLGTLTAAFLPVFSTYLSKGEKGKKEAFEVAESLFFITTVLLVLCAVILFILTPIIVPLIAPGFDVHRMALMVTLSRIMLLQPILLGASSILGTILTSFNRFFAYAVAPVLYNLGIIFGVIFFVPSVGVRGVAWGVVLGAILHLLIQLPGTWKLGFRFKFSLRWKHEGLKNIGRLMVPRLIGLLAGQVNDLVVNFIGSTLLVGSIAVYAFADNLQNVPIGLVGISFAVAAFPQLSRAVAENAPEIFSHTLIKTMRLILFLAVPLSAAMYLLRSEIVRVILGAGRFDWNDTKATFTVLSILVVSVFAQSLVPLLARAFFAMHDTKTPMVASIVTIIVNLVGAFFLGIQYGVVGLAWAFTVASIVNFLILVVVLRTRLGGLDDKYLLSGASRMLFATLLAGVTIQLLKMPIGNMVNMQTFLGVFIKLFGSGLGGAVVYLIASRLLKLEEFDVLFGGVRQLLFKKQTEPVAIDE
ncbi:MAG: murein biosynthesis integral membrane protein MurJ [bacterium]|nr:murein biosynthesis integral membrane protein MurJ [bacterium]